MAASCRLTTLGAFLGRVWVVVGPRLGRETHGPGQLSTGTTVIVE